MNTNAFDPKTQQLFDPNVLDFYRLCNFFTEKLYPHYAK